MLKSPLHEFVNDCIARNQDADGLTQEELYGLYLSWCSLRGSTPAPARTFRAGLRAVNIRPNQRGGLCTGLAMTGPAACDYILHRELPLAPLPQEIQGNAADDIRTAPIGRELTEGNGPASAPAA
ncbi:hypothetical protein SAMN04487916_10363 [Arthrobacter sp. ov407]|uniref:hypothetical protein n=1 Tax=Arthrobacter sp. ov407 TaxID=1761748 RepID=UPI00088F9CD7|nr:hypothetical protein [Arthrobacter sp. ov407]SDK78484.1 hypothetical protein SAMN04487916_10363 [Arthrobacter sp. ov407]